MSDAPHSLVERQRATISAFVSAFIIISFIMIGFITMIATIVLNRTIDPPGEWLAAMLSLASTALGFLAGERSGKKSSGRCPCIEK